VIGATLFEPVEGVVGPHQVWRATIGTQTYFVKRTVDQPVEQMANVLKAIKHSLPPDSTIEIPTVLSADNKQQLFVTAALPGVPLSELLNQSDPHDPIGRGAIRRIGAALAELHNISTASGEFEWLPIVTMQDHLRRLVAPDPREVSSNSPQWQQVIEEALLLLKSVDEGRTGPQSTSLLHGDFHVRQVVVGNNIGIVDWDLAARGDGLFDVAFFTTYLETHHLDPDGSLRHIFCDEYGVMNDRSSNERLRAYRIFNLLRRACRRQRIKDERWLVERDRMLSLIALDLGVTQ
jgi:aminoglycoside phosphotransferase (APT) family kinase protein